MSTFWGTVQGTVSHHTPMVGFEKSQNFVNFWIFPHPHYLNSIQKVFKNFGNIQNILPPAKKTFTPTRTYTYKKNTTQLHFVVFFDLLNIG